MPMIKFGIFAAVALIFATLGPSVAFAWSPGAGGSSIPGFAGLWQEPNPRGFSQGMKTGRNGRSVPPGWSSGKKKGRHGANVPPGLSGH
jgi:hypothetical protein